MPDRTAWIPYRPPEGAVRPSTVTGDLRVLPALSGPPGGPDRDILVLLPRGAEASGRRYPVLYMHDGQNLFDAATAYRDEWQVDETVAGLATDGLEVIVVGVPNAGELRYAEYTPYRGRRKHAHGGLGRGYVRWLVEVVKPTVDAAWPTLAGRETTGILGSSLGGLISLWAAVAHPDIFGLVGAMSTAITPGQNAIIRRCAALPVPPLRAYLDIGGREADDAATEGMRRYWSARMVEESRQLRDALLASGLEEGRSLLYVEDADAVHREIHWAERLPRAARFLFGS